ncbi:MAG TPA: 16S rRNA (guanine(966)-N(2))-methyltransferase RsmD [Syntrophorhabdaceae bacterium]|nr:16S rRNA (guanine(966)-N(2))-methyltransferase RsmD [Syntrophorhabdaceae bacterium]
MRRIRITGGSMKGRFVVADDDIDARHTSSKVRESVFNMLGDIKNKKVIDLFSGSGILAFESLSRGASMAAMVEIDHKMARKLEENASYLRVNEICKIINMDVFHAIPFLYNTGDIFDIIFMDPPYEKGFIMDTMKLLEKNTIYDNESIFIVESSKREMLDNNISGAWRILKQKRYGDTIIEIIKSNLFSKIKIIQGEINQ